MAEPVQGGRAAQAAADTIAAEISGAVSSVARQSYQSQTQTWDVLEAVLQRAASTTAPYDVRYILGKADWFHRSAMLSGVTAFVANHVSSLAMAATTIPAFEVLVGALLDPLATPCMDDVSGKAGKVARACRWRRELGPFADMLCTKRWEAFSRALAALAVNDSARLAGVLEALDLLPLFSSKTTCAVVALDGFFAIFTGDDAGASGATMVHTLVRGLLRIDWTSPSRASYRDELLVRLFRRLQELPFSTAPALTDSLLHGLQTALIDATITPHEGVVLLMKLAGLVSPDVVAAVLGGCFDAGLSSAPLPENKPLLFLMGACAHTALVPDDTIIALLVQLFSDATAAPKHVRLTAAYYIALHRMLDLRKEHQLRALLLADAEIHRQVPEEVTSAFFATCFRMDARAIDNWLRAHDVLAGADDGVVPWAELVPFATLALHPRAAATSRLSNEPPCVLQGATFEADVVARRTKRRRTARTSAADCLAPDVLQHIFAFLSPKRIARVAAVSRAFAAATADPLLWRRLYLAPSRFLAPIVCQHPPTYVHDYRALFAERYRAERAFRKARLTSGRRVLVLCNICGCVHVSKSTSLAFTHTKQHATSRTYKAIPCPECPEHFAFKNKLIEHRRAAHGFGRPRRIQASPDSCDLASPGSGSGDQGSASSGNQA
ncbi:hypothetical protein ACHHYP_02535 [Achlya hypogyna]|uniref:C2H2-type domain-containing protein n=1 Tax=Achlya hypogyna TaxID=1202772 RepID=A0A1V9Z5Z2_ACHHY|nr:hypothetical protein ACHHYP_02535 [Achlya hypogyna]